MVTATKSKVAEPVATEADLKAALEEARQAWSRAQRLANESDSPFERLSARRRLPELAAQAEAAEFQLAEFQVGAVERERARRDALIAATDPEVKQRLAHLLPILEQAEAAMQDFQRFAQDADHRLGGHGSRYSLLAFSALVGDVHSESALTTWRRYLKASGWLP